jgi:hypothetical protein
MRITLKFWTPQVAYQQFMRRFLKLVEAGKLRD